MRGRIKDWQGDAAIEAAPMVSEAPPLPMATHIVSAALCAERLRVLAEKITLLMQHAPHDAATFARLHGDALEAWCDLDTHYSALTEIRDCKGQG